MQGDLAERTDPEPRIVRANWALLAAAFGDDTPGVRWYLHTVTGELVRVVEDERTLATFLAEGYLAIERARSKEQYRWMERYIAAVADRALAAELSHAIAGKQAFQRFRAVLAKHPGRTDEWYTFRGKQLARYMRAWLAAHDIVVPRHPPNMPVGLAPAAGLSIDGEDADDGPLTRREQLEVLITQLSFDDLESLLALAELLELNAYARRIQYG